MTDQLRRQAVRLYDEFTHVHLDRRRLMHELTALTGSAAAALALLPALAASPAAAAQISAEDPRLTTGTHEPTLSTGRKLKAYHAWPKAADMRKLPGVIVIHENRGLNDHIRDVARRVALAGYAVVAPDFLTVSGGTPADEDAARKAIGALNRDETAADAAALAAHAKAEHGRVGAVGFCWGGALVNSLAEVAGPDLDAVVAYYGPAPNLAQVGRIKSALLFQRAGLDDRVNAGYPAYLDALKAAGVRYEDHVYAGVNHAFNNDTSAERYNKAAADEAWNRTMAFFAAHLKGAGA
ncbi:MAG: dienelactone hydrolase family protein [Sphingomonadaceae bacterium]|nr:dienelactone hydrolase family protein [Sphingomonadaceae bacterium]